MEPHGIYFRTDQVVAALQKRYEPPGFAFLTEVGNATSWDCNRHCDAMAMGLWKSRGIKLHGFEVKVSRSDWRKEFKSPAKAEAIAVYCDYWWVAVSDFDIVKDGELPETWGLLVMDAKGKLVVAKDAPLNSDPKTINRPFLAALLRKSIEQKASAAEIAAAVEKAKKENDELHKRSAGYELNRLLKIEKDVRDFEDASGIKISHRWDGVEKIGEQLRKWLDREDDEQSARERLAGLLEQARNITASLERHFPTEEQTETPLEALEATSRRRRLRRHLVG